MTSKLAEEVQRQLAAVESLVSDLESMKQLTDANRDEFSVRFNRCRADHKEISDLLTAVSSDKHGLKVAEEADAEFTDEKLAELQAEEAALEREKAQLQEEEHRLQEEMLAILQDRSNLERKEEEFWNMANKIEIDNIELEEESTFTRQQIMSFNSELDRLSKIYILNEVFDIQIRDGSIPTISKLHMGWLPDTGSINWDETNAGFGHTLLLLNYLCVRNGISIPNVEFEPLGNISSIKILRKESKHPKECKLAGPPQDEVRAADCRTTSTKAWCSWSAASISSRKK